VIFLVTTFLDHHVHQSEIILRPKKYLILLLNIYGVVSGVILWLCKM